MELTDHQLEALDGLRRLRSRGSAAFLALTLHLWLLALVVAALVTTLHWWFLETPLVFLAWGAILVGFCGRDVMHFFVFRHVWPVLDRVIDWDQIDELLSGSRFLRIVALPPGEAPEAIRNAWIGVEIPVTLSQARETRIVGFGVLSAPETFVKALWAVLRGKATVYRRGYWVGVTAAIDALEQTSPDAARWWRENAPLLNSLAFPADVCEIVDHGGDRDDAEPHKES